jgi:phosphoglycolate phosphatase
MNGVPRPMHLREVKPNISLIFDLDGTLIDSCPGIGSSLSAAFDSIGRKMPAADLRAIVGPPIRVIAARIEPTLSETELVQIELSYRTRYDSDGWRETVPFDGVAETLQALHLAGVSMFIVTNKPRIPTEKILTQLRLIRLFKEISTRDSRTPAYDSKTEMLFGLLQRYSLNRESSVMVGDTIEDEEAAAANGLRFLYATYGYGSIKNPHFPISQFAEISKLFAMQKLK